MTMTRTEFWTAAGVVVAAVVGGFAAGYYFGQDTAEAKIEDLTQRIGNLKKVTDMDVPLLLDTLDQRSADLGEKIRLSEQIRSLNEKISTLNTDLATEVEKNRENRKKIKNMEAEVKRLTSLVSKDFSEVSEIVVYKYQSTWIVPGIIAISISQFLGSSTHTTITNTLDGKWINLGERVDINYNKSSCFVILTKIHKPSATFSFACLNEQN